MNILVIGSGGREHALVWKLTQSRRVKKIYCAPGNGGITQHAECADIAADDIAGLVAFAKEKAIDLTVVGPEAPLVAGAVDVFKAEGLTVFGPDANCARLEGSKVFAKECMDRFGLPTAAFKVFDNADEAKAYVSNIELPHVIKADGLCAGKGVVVAQSLAESHAAIEAMLTQKVFGTAGEKIIIEACLVGEEVSILALVDGKNFAVLSPSQDHKQIFDGDLGPNTGGMGAYSPALIVDAAMIDSIAETVIKPLIDGLAAEGNAYTGVLYAGLMITETGPQLLEFNVRFGDPEIQAIMPRLKNDLVDILMSCCNGTLDKHTITWDERTCVCVVAASGGYPNHYEKGKAITGLESSKGDKDVVVFHAGTTWNQEKALFQTAGGRVLGVTALGATIEEAIQKAYTTLSLIDFDGMYFRKDIGYKAIKKT